jgi:hypothetical protein
MSTNTTNAAHNQPKTQERIHMRNCTNSEIEELLDGFGLHDDLVRTLLMFATHEYFSYRRDDNLDERDLFEFACVVLSWLSLVKEDDNDSFTWAHTRKLQRMMNRNLHKWKTRYDNQYEWRPGEYKFGFVKNNLFKKILDHFEKNPEILSLIHHGRASE